MRFVPETRRDDANLVDDTSQNIFLPNWTDENWDNLLRHTQTLIFSPGETIVRAGSDEKALYIVAFGKVAMFVNLKRRMRILLTKHGINPAMTVVENGSVINIPTFLDGRPGFATYRAATQCQLVYLNVDAFAVFSVRQPDLARDILLDLGRLLAVQVRQMTGLLASYGGD